MDGTTRVSETWVGTVPDTNYRVVNTGDDDGDGKADILWHHATLGEVWVWRMDGATPLVADVGGNRRRCGLPNREVNPKREAIG